MRARDKHARNLAEVLDFSQRVKPIALPHFDPPPAQPCSSADVAYRVAEESNRMGIRLQGPALPSPGGHMITEGVALGAVQAPPGGQPIVLFVEHQTTGGYPKIANIISADMASIGQLRPRDEVRFERVTMAEARRLLLEQERLLTSEMLEI